MQEVVKKDIINVLKKVTDILSHEEPDTFDLKKLSNHTIHNASIYQDEHSISIAILTYSLSKIIERIHNIDYRKITNLLALSIGYLEKNNEEFYKDTISKLFKIISSSDSKVKFYIQEVIGQASIKKGSKMYEHGISASKTAELLGISIWEMYNYLGATSIADSGDEPISVRERLKIARGLFR